MIKYLNRKEKKKHRYIPNIFHFKKKKECQWHQYNIHLADSLICLEKIYRTGFIEHTTYTDILFIRACMRIKQIT